MMDERKLPDMKTGSVKAAAKILEGNKLTVKKSHKQTREHGIDEAKSELSAAKRTVKDLTRRIEEANSRSNARTQSEAMRELHSIKHEVSKLKLDMASVSEETKRAEEKSVKALSKTELYLNSVRELNKEIEETNEEHVLVELARIEAIKEYEEIEAGRIEKAAFYSGKLEENRKKIQEMDRETQETKELEAKLATTVSEMEFLESELKGFEGRDERIENNEEFASVINELEAAKNQVSLVKEDSFRIMESMDIVRNEHENVAFQTARLKKKEEKTEANILNLNSKLLRAKARLEAMAALDDNSESMFSDQTVALGRFRVVIEAYKTDQSLIKEEISVIKKDIEAIENETDISEERLQAAMQDLRAAKSSEMASLENLRLRIEKTMRNRTSASSTICVSEFEYKYLKGGAAAAKEVAEKKVEAAKAWIEALKASEKELEMKLREEVGKIGENEELTSDGNDFEKWRQMMESEMSKKVSVGFPSKGLSRSVKRMTPVRLGFPMVRGASLSARRRRKVMPNLAKLFGAKSIEANL